MAYLDNRQQIATDTFDTQIDSGLWANGDGDFGTCSFVTGGHVEPSSTATHSAIRRTFETYNPDQYCKVIVEAHGGADGEIAACVRAQAGTDESCYMGFADTSTDDYSVWELDSNMFFTIVGSATADPGTEIPLTQGDSLTLEGEGTTLRLGSDAGGSDVQKVSVTDNTITTGEPLIDLKGDAVADARITSWEGGDIRSGLKVTTDLTIITTAEVDTNWSDIGSQSAALEPDFFVQGSNCLSRAVSNSKKGMAFDNGSGIDFTTGTHQDKLVYIWVRVNTPQLCDIRANGGVAIRLSGSSATSNWREWYVDGSDTLPATEGWICYVIDPQSAGNTDSGTYSAASVQHFGATIDTTTSAKGQNLGIDQIAYGRGELLVSGYNSVAGEGFKEIADVAFDAAAVNRWGIMTPKAGTFFVRGKIIIGAADCNTIFSSSDEVVIFETPTYDNGTNIVKTIPDASVGATNGTDGVDSYNGLAFLGGATLTQIDFGVLVGSDSGRSGSFLSCPEQDDLSTPGRTTATITVDNSTMALSLYATSFIGFEGIIDLLGTGVLDDDCFAVTFNGCDRIQSNMEFRKCSILNSVADAADGALIWLTTTNVEDCLFANNSRAIVIELTPQDDFVFTDLIFSDNTFDVRNESTEAKTINVFNGTVPTVENSGGGSSTTVNDIKVVEVSGLTEGSAVIVEANETVGTVTIGDILASGFANDSGIFTYQQNYEAAFGSGLDVIVRARNQGIATAVILDDNGAFTDLTSEANSTVTNDLTLLPATPVVNEDSIQFGHDEQFGQLRLFMTTAGTGGFGLTWEYWNGSSWGSLSGVSDATSDFSLTGERIVSWTIPGDWATRTDNSQGPFFYVRARYTSGTVTIVPLARRVTLDVTRYIPFVQDREITTNGLAVTASWIVDSIGQF